MTMIVRICIPYIIDEAKALTDEQAQILDDGIEIEWPHEVAPIIGDTINIQSIIDFDKIPKMEGVKKHIWSLKVEERWFQRYEEHDYVSLIIDMEEVTIR